MNHGTFKIIRIDGTEEVYEGEPPFDEIRRLIGCDYLDYVTLDRRRHTLMLVDDTGMVDGKPVNAKATARYHAVCKPGTVHQIHGDVAIINDKESA